MKLALAFFGFMFLLWGIAFKLFLIGGGSSYDQFLHRREELTGSGGSMSRSFHRGFYWLADHRVEIGFVGASMFVFAILI